MVILSGNHLLYPLISFDRPLLGQPVYNCLLYYYLIQKRQSINIKKNCAYKTTLRHKYLTLLTIKFDMYFINLEL